jgi:PAS domain S-box-containing protein
VIRDARDLIGLIAFVLSCAIIVGFGGPMRSRQRRLAAQTAKALASEAAHRRTAQHLQIVTDCMAAPVTHCSRDLRYLWVNKTFAEWFGRPAEEIAGRPIIDILGQAVFEQLLPRFKQVLLGMKVHYEQEVDYPRLGRRWISAIYTPTFDQTEVPDGWVAVVLDVTDRKRAEAVLAQSEQRLAARLEAMTRLQELEREVLDIAAREQARIGQELHDSVGQELTGLGLMADALAQRLHASSSAEPAAEELAAKVADGLARVHEQVRALSRGLVPVELDPAGLWSALEDLAVRSSVQSGIPCTFESTGPAELTDASTATHMFRIAQEAVSNALRHGRPRRVRIVLAAEATTLSVSVQDDGIGVAVGGAAAGQGKGLGIRLMRYRAGIIGGSLTVEAADGGGTCVTCSIPRKLEHA